MNKTETKSTVLLKHHLKALKLPTMHTECEKIARRRAAQDNADHLAFLLQLVRARADRTGAEVCRAEVEDSGALPGAQAAR